MPPLHDLHKVNIKYEYSVKTNRIFSQYWLNKQYGVAEVIHCSLVEKAKSRQKNAMSGEQIVTIHVCI